MKSFLNRSTESARNELTNQGLQVNVIGNGSKVLAQYPPQDKTVYENDQVFLITNDSSLLLPNLVGYSNKLATSVLELLGITVTTEGTGYVTAQSLPEGSPITKGMEIHLTLAPKFDG